MKKDGSRTIKEIRTPIKREVDAFVEELLKKYPEILGSLTLENLISQEVGWAIEEIRREGRTLTNKERWS